MWDEKFLRLLWALLEIFAVSMSREQAKAVLDSVARWDIHPASRPFDVQGEMARELISILKIRAQTGGE